jgi:hypothetical protein
MDALSRYIGRRGEQARIFQKGTPMHPYLTVIIWKGKKPPEYSEYSHARLPMGPQVASQQEPKNPRAKVDDDKAEYTNYLLHICS